MVSVSYYFSGEFEAAYRIIVLFSRAGKIYRLANAAWSASI
jgi:hypothetical protein